MSSTWGAVVSYCVFVCLFACWLASVFVCFLACLLVCFFELFVGLRFFRALLSYCFVLTTETSSAKAA